jgi:hypothetical protein
MQRKSLLTMVLEGKNAVTPLMAKVPGTLMEGLTSGQRNATRMILETRDRFTLVQGYAGVGKTTQFRGDVGGEFVAGRLRPKVIGLGPTHRAVGEMQSAGVRHRPQPLSCMIHSLMRSGQTPDFSNTLFLVDESSMLGLSDTAKAMSLISAGGGRGFPAVILISCSLLPRSAFPAYAEAQWPMWPSCRRSCDRCLNSARRYSLIDRDIQCTFHH